MNIHHQIHEVFNEKDVGVKHRCVLQTHDFHQTNKSLLMTQFIQQVVEAVLLLGQFKDLLMKDPAKTLCNLTHAPILF